MDFDFVRDKQRPFQHHTAARAACIQVGPSARPASSRPPFSHLRSARSEQAAGSPWRLAPDAADLRELQAARKWSGLLCLPSRLFSRMPFDRHLLFWVGPLPHCPATPPCLLKDHWALASHMRHGRLQSAMSSKFSRSAGAGSRQQKIHGSGDSCV